MTIKHHAYNLHAALKTAGIGDVTRSQVHELIAAGCGYATYASFASQCVLCDVPWADAGAPPSAPRISARCVELGLDAEAARQVAAVAHTYLGSLPHAPVRLEALIASADEDDPDDHDEWSQWVADRIYWPLLVDDGDLAGRFPVLVAELEARADRGLAIAHLALARLLQDAASVGEEDDARFGRELASRGSWTSPPVPIAQCDGSFAHIVAKHRHHLLAAARAGDRRALLETAERYSDPGMLDLGEPADVDPIRMADLARSAGRPDVEREWLTKAAREGDIAAMADLIEYFDIPLLEAWTWVHLSRLLGEDLSEDRHIAINEDGSDYDFDIGGPAYVGGRDGIELPPLSNGDDAIAVREARVLFDALNAKV